MKGKTKTSKADLRLKYFSRRVIQRIDGIIRDLELLGMNRAAETLSKKKNAIVIAFLYELRTDKKKIDASEKKIVENMLISSNFI